MPSPPPPCPSRRARRIGLAWAVLAAVVAPGCRSNPAARQDPAGSTERCGEACAVLTGSGCDRDGSRPRDLSACVEHCVVESRSATRAGCERERRAYLGCVAGQRLDCSAACSAPLCLERGEGLAKCSAEHAALERCRAPCRHAGVVSLVDRDAGGVALLAEVVRAGCDPCPSVAPRAPVGAACTAASVCSQSCCVCPDGRARYLVRACVDGACVEAPRACAIVGASGADACP